MGFGDGGGGTRAPQRLGWWRTQCKGGPPFLEVLERTKISFVINFGQSVGVVRLEPTECALPTHAHPTLLPRDSSPYPLPLIGVIALPRTK
jgi:hypothetical protein